MFIQTLIISTLFTIFIVGYKLFIPLIFSPLIIISCKNNSNNIFKVIVQRFDRLFLYWISTLPSHTIRMFFYKRVWNINIEKDVVIYYGLEIREPNKLKIGRGTIIGNNAVFDARAGITIGEDVNFSSEVNIWTYQHDYRDPLFRSTPQNCGPVFIGDKAWIGPRVTILHDVNIGEGAVVAAGSVVTKDVPPFSVVAGIPAKIISERLNNLQYNFSGEHLHFL